MAWLSFYDITGHVIFEFFLMSYMEIRTLPKRLLRGVGLYSLGGLLCGRGFIVLPKSMRLPLNSKGFFKGGISSSLGGFWDINNLGLIAKSWD
jgi:hypothetical protein